MTVERRRHCKRCGQQFVPRRDNYWNCDSCFQDTRPIGFTKINRRAGAASHRHGGVSRLADGRRPVTLRGNKTRKNILEGLNDFLFDLYRRSTRLSGLLQEQGAESEQLKLLSDPLAIDDLVMRFCPELRAWLIATVGLKSTDIIIDFYGLYGEPRRTSEAIAKDWGLGESDITKLRLWGLKQLRTSKNDVALREIVIIASRDILARRHSKTVKGHK